MNITSGLRIDIEYEMRAEPGPSLTLDDLIDVFKMKNMQIFEINRAENYLIVGKGKDMAAVLGRPE